MHSRIIPLMLQTISTLASNWIEISTGDFGGNTFVTFWVKWRRDASGLLFIINRNRNVY